MDKFYTDYVAHLPTVPVDAPREPGGVSYIVFHHDDWCTIFDKPAGTMADCNCCPAVVVLWRHFTQ
jgi:hypothetical protein